MTNRPALIRLLLEHSVRWGEFTLKSGKTSDFYVDVRQTALHSEGSWILADAVLSALRPDVVAIGGVELGAVPIVGSIITLEQVRHRINLGLAEVGKEKFGLDAELPPTHHGFIVRKAPKDHGTQAKIERCPPEGTKVCIVEDVTTSGGSLEKAITAAWLAGLDVIQVITIVDREEGAEELLRAGGYEGAFTALVTRTNLSI